MEKALEAEETESLQKEWHTKQGGDGVGEVGGYGGAPLHGESLQGIQEQGWVWW